MNDNNNNNNNGDVAQDGQEEVIVDAPVADNNANNNNGNDDNDAAVQENVIIDQVDDNGVHNLQKQIINNGRVRVESEMTVVPLRVWREMNPNMMHPREEDLLEIRGDLCVIVQRNPPGTVHRHQPY